jgi:hypothetical protein
MYLVSINVLSDSISFCVSVLTDTPCVHSDLRGLCHIYLTEIIQTSKTINAHRFCNSKSTCLLR